MVYTNPTSISNSSNQQNFTNQKSKIHMLNLNLENNGNIYNNFLVQQFNEYQSNTSSITQSNTSINDNDFMTILQNQKKNSKYLSFKY